MDARTGYAKLTGRHSRKEAHRSVGFHRPLSSPFERSKGSLNSVNEVQHAALSAWRPRKGYAASDVFFRRDFKIRRPVGIENIHKCQRAVRLNSEHHACPSAGGYGHGGYTVQMYQNLSGIICDVGISGAQSAARSGASRLAPPALTCKEVRSVSLIG